MSKSWTIYDKSGNIRLAPLSEQGEGGEPVRIDTLELHDEWMAECFITLSFKSAYPIPFEIGDYVDYRGERYCINYDPTVIKKARMGSYAEGFTYDNIKFANEAQDKVVRCDFTDIVLNDNQLHYTALSTFPFYCETVDDLLDRIQACLEELYPGEFTIVSADNSRNRTRGTVVGRVSEFEAAYTKWIGGGGATGSTNVSLTADNLTCWDALKMVHDQFGVNFIIRGYDIIVGTAGSYTANKFRYGRGRGLYEIERISDSSQQVVTRLRAYGNTTNLPSRYYANIGLRCFATIVDSEQNSDIPYSKHMFNSVSQEGESDVVIEYGGVRYDAVTRINATTGKTIVQTNAMLLPGDKIYFVSGHNQDLWPSAYKEYTSGDNLPNNMAVNRLMLPGFPKKSLLQWVRENRPQLLEEGFSFSDDPYRPYIDSPNVERYGVRPATIVFDGNNDTSDIYPTIIGMTHGGHACDVIVGADTITDNGIYGEGDVPNFSMTLPDMGFDLAAQWQSGACISIKDGMCGGRDFEIASKPKRSQDGSWICNCQRSKDDTLDLWFPYSDFQIHAGDHYVLVGIEMPDEYINKASERLFDAAIEALRKNHDTRYTYQPKIDELWMARQHDESVASDGVVTSIHDTIKAGDIFQFEDEDLGIDAAIIIDVLAIKENGNNGIPTYEVTLRDEKQVSTIEKIQNKIDSLSSGGNGFGGGGGGMSGAQVRSIVESEGKDLFLSKTSDDEAAGIIGFLKGFWVKAKGLFGIDGEGNATVNDLTVKGATTLAHVWADIIRSGNFSGYGIGDTGWELTNSVEGSGKSQLTVDIIQARMKIIATALEVRKWYGVGGNFVASPSAGTVWKVAYYDGEGEELGWKTVTVPWRGGGRLLMGIANGVRRLLGRQKRVSRELTAEERLRVRRIRCYLYSDDGTTMTQGNISIGSQMRCQTFNTASMKETADGYIADHLRTSYWWRVVSNIGSEPVAEDDGRIHDYVDFDVQTGPDGQDDPNVADTGSDWPQPGDQMVEFGHRTDTDRQHVITLETVGADAPALKEYQGINSFSLEGKRKTMISPRGGSEIYATKFVIQTEYDEVRVPADRGLWIDIPLDGNGQRRCYYYDRVAHNGSLWLCVIQEYKTVYADADGNEISVEQYDALPVEQQKRYKQKRVKNYTTVEPSEQAVGIWQKEVYTQIPARLVLSRKLVPVDCESDGKASEAVSMEIEARLMVTNLECEGVSLELSQSSGNIHLSQDGKRIEVGYAKGDSVTGTDVTVTATGTLLGQQYSASDSLSIYPVRKGEEGASAYEVTCSTNSFILNQQEDEPYEIQTSGAETTIDVRRNGEQQPWRIVSVAYVVDVYNGSATNGYNEIVTSWSDAAGVGAKTVTVTYVKNNIKQAHLLITVEYGNSQQRTLRILIACNLLGTWKQKVIGDAENVWAEKTKYTYTDEQGVEHTMTVQDFYAHYERSSEAMSEEFKSVKQSLETNTNTMNTLSTNVAEYKRSADAMTEQWGEFQGEVEDAKEAMSQAKNAMDDAVDKYDTLDGKIKDAKDAADDAATKAGTAITTSTKSATGLEILTGKFENPQYNDDGSLKSVGKLSALSGYVQTDEFAKIFSRIILNDPTEKETIEGYVQTKAESVSLGVVSTKIGKNNEEIKQRTGIDITRGLIRLNNKTVIEGSLNVVDDGAGFSLIGSTGTTNITRKSVGTYEEWQQQTTATKVASGSAEGSVGAENAQFIIEIPFTIDMPGTVVFRGQTINFAKSSGSVLQKPQRGTVEYEVDGDSITEWSTLSDNPGSCSKVLNSAGSHTLTITVTAYDIASAGWTWAYNEERVAECYFSCLIDYPTANLVQIGYDGIAMNYGTNKNIYLAAENTTFRYGNIGFRVDSTGVWVASKLNDSGGLLWTQFIKPDDSGGVSVSWNNISDKPKYVFAVKIGSKKKEAESTSGSTLEFTLDDIGAMPKTYAVGRGLVVSGNTIYLTDQNGNMLGSQQTLPSGGDNYVPKDGCLHLSGRYEPSTNGGSDLGSSNYRFGNIYGQNVYGNSGSFDSFSVNGYASSTGSNLALIKLNGSNSNYIGHYNAGSWGNGMAIMTNDLEVNGGYHISIFTNSNYGTSSYIVIDRGTITASHAITVSSDRRMKDELENITDMPIDWFADAPLVKFCYMNDTQRTPHIGSYAQYFEDILPETVSETEDPVTKEKHLSLDYTGVTVAGVITAAREIVALKKEVAAKDTMIKNLEKDLADERERRDNIEQRLKRVEELLWEIIENREN